MVTTTLVRAEQDAAYEAVRKNVLAYDQRHGYRGPEGFVVLPRDAAQHDKAIESTLQKYSDSDNLLVAVVRSASPTRVQALRPNGELLDITGDGLRRASVGLSSKAKAALRIKVGSVIRVAPMGKGRWQISQLPNVGAALVALNNQTGAYHALVGGFDFGASPFNHVTQAWRQPGSAMKPFIYSAALDKGYSPATMVNDAPLTLSSAETGGQPWSPQNDDGVYDGAISLRVALAQSKNVAAVRLLRAITPQYAHDFLPRFGFDGAKQPVNYTLSLGTGAATPLQMAGAYSVFANGGFAINPYLIQKVVDIRGTVLFEAKPVVVAQESARVLDARNAFITSSMLHEVTVSGTGASATQKLGRNDLAGKTGTSSDAIDGWFAGFSGATTAVAWMGFDEPRSLGSREFGATVALPIWMDYMRVALHGKPPNTMPAPPGVSYVAGDWLYDDFKATGGVTSLDLDLLERLKGWLPP
jgi:penicillin-binding protein 1A